MKTHINYTTTPDSISFFFDGKMHNISKSDISFKRIHDIIVKQEDKDITELRRLISPAKAINNITGGKVVADEDKEKVFYDGVEVNNTLTNKLLAVLRQGDDATPWINFMENIMLNPSYNSRECLFNFLQNFAAPLTKDGCFIAFKRVRNDYRDIHSGKFDNSPGKVVSMPRHLVNDDPTQTCSAGLHACATSYLGNFYASYPGYKVVAVKINPKDVVAVPKDYQFSKMRVCEYTVLSDAEEAQIEYWNKSALA